MIKSTLPLHLPITELRQSEQQDILNLAMLATRANAVYRLTIQYQKEQKLFKQEILQLFIHCLSIFQASIENAGKLVNNLTTGLKYSTEYQNSVQMLLEFLQNRFNECLKRAQELGNESLSNNLLIRTPQRIIYETGISTAKSAANAELLNKPSLDTYKTAILLLESLVEFKKVGEIGVDEARNLDQILRQLHARISN